MLGDKEKYKKEKKKNKNKNATRKLSRLGLSRISARKSFHVVGFHWLCLDPFAVKFAFSFIALILQNGPPA
jgi:hypothetical protein